MPYFSWTSDLAVGNAMIDRDHERLVELVNSLHEAMSQGKAKGILGSTLDELVNYTKEHFRREEAEMVRIRFHHASAHRQEHSKLISDVADLQKKFKEGKTMLTLEVFNFLKEWLNKHIKQTDRVLADAIKKAS